MTTSVQMNARSLTAEDLKVQEWPPLILPSKHAILKAARAVAKLEAANLAHDYELQFSHIRYYHYVDNSYAVDPKGGVTLAYKVPRGGGQVVEVATAICSPKDVYDKVLGKAMAAHNFVKGEKIKIRLGEPRRWGQQLQTLFGTMT